MKKVLVLLLALTMTLSLAACGSSSESSENSSAQENTPSEPEASFEGKWVFVGGEMDGEPMTLTYLSYCKDYVLSIDGDRAELGPAGQENVYTFTKDDDKNAKISSNDILTILDDGTLQLVEESDGKSMMLLFAREGSDAVKAFEEAYLAEVHKYDPPTVEEKVVYDNNDIKVTLTGMDSDQYSITFNVTVENNRTSGDVSVTPMYVVINGIQMQSYAENEGFVDQGINETKWTVYRNSLEAAGINEIVSIETDVNVYYSNRSEQTGLLELYSNGKQPQTSAFDGTVLYETDKAKVVYLGYKKNGILGTPEVYYYVENNTASYMSIQDNYFKTDTDDSIWGSYINLNPGSRAVGVLRFYYSADPAEISMDFMMYIEGNYITTERFTTTVR